MAGRVRCMLVRRRAVRICVRGVGVACVLCSDVLCCLVLSCVVLCCVVLWLVLFQRSC